MEQGQRKVSGLVISFFSKIGQEDVLAMVDGGGFQYDAERSVIGNGSLEFTPTGEWFLRYVGPVEEGGHLFHMEISVL